MTCRQNNSPLSYAIAIVTSTIGSTTTNNGRYGRSTHNPVPGDPNVAYTVSSQELGNGLYGGVIVIAAVSCYDYTVFNYDEWTKSAQVNQCIGNMITSYLRIQNLPPVLLHGRINQTLYEVLHVMFALPNLHLLTQARCAWTHPRNGCRGDGDHLAARCCRR